MKGPYRAFALLGWIGTELLLWTLGPYALMLHFFPEKVRSEWTVLGLLIGGLLVFLVRLFQVLKRFEER